jgi:hypothetical protein
LLVVNYSAGALVRIVPDLAVVPGAPVAFSGTFADDIATLRWSVPPGEGTAVDFVVERIRDGRVVERVTLERRELTLSASAGDCFRVRGRAGSGATGPPSERICVPTP